jgi:hypothetical protein
MYRLETGLSPYRVQFQGTWSRERQLDPSLTKERSEPKQVALRSPHASGLINHKDPERRRHDVKFRRVRGINRA